MIHKGIDITQCHLYQVSEDCAKSLIDWRLQRKKGITQRIFDNALKDACRCIQYGISAEEALDRWMESGWTGMKWVLKEMESEKTSIRGRSMLHKLTDRSWAN